MPQQLSFDLPSRTALGRDDFFISEANALAVAQVEQDDLWPNGKLVLGGPKGAGKTHLSHVWASQSGAKIIDAAGLEMPEENAVVVEDVHTIAGHHDAEEMLFHIHNAVLGRGGRLLLTGIGAPNHWPIALADLASRLQGTALVQIDEPDDMLLMAVLVKGFADRQLQPTPAVLTYLLRHSERSFAHAHQIVAAMDKRALSERRTINRDLARDVLADLAR